MSSRALPGQRDERAPTRLGVYAERTAETGWLAALVLVPLFVNVDSIRPFDPGKASILRLLALVVVGAWIVARVERRALRPSRAAFHDPVAWAVGLLLAANVVATVASLSPAVSIAGSFERGQGLATLLVYVGIFAVAADGMRSRAQVERAATVALAAAVPAAVYALVQRYSLDPLALQAAAPSSVRPDSTLGGALFLGAYLLMVAPVALARLLRDLERAGARSPPGRALLAAAAAASVLVPVLGWTAGAPSPSAVSPTRAELETGQLRFHLALALAVAVLAPWLVAGWRRRNPPVLAVGANAAVLALLVAAIVATRARGPLVGLVVGAVTVCLLAAAARRSAPLAFGSLAAAAAAVLVLATVGVQEPRQAAPVDEGEEPAARRLLDVGSGSGRIRTLLWETGLEAVGSREPLWSPARGEDALVDLRVLIGYGPDSTSAVLGQFSSLELGRLTAGATADRVHNQVVETFVQTGSLGLLAYLLLVGSILALAVRATGTDARSPPLGLCVGGGAALGLAAAAASRRLELVGLAVPGGMVLGFGASLVGSAVARRSASAPGDAATWLSAGLAGGLVGHVIESQSGIVTTATATLFWLFAAALVAVRRLRATRPPLVDEQTADGRGGLMVGLALAALVFAFASGSVAAAEGPAAGAGRLVLRGLALKQTTEGLAPSSGAAWVLAFALLGALAWAFPGGWRRTLATAGTAAGILVAFSVPHAVLAERAGEGDRDAPVWSTWYFLGFACAVVLVLGSGKQSPSVLRLASPAGLLVGAAALALAGFAAWTSVVQEAQADVLLARASALPALDVERVHVARQARDAQPRRDYPLLFLADAYVRTAQRAGGRDRQAALAAAEDALERLRELDPFDADATIGLARLARVAADEAPAGERRSRLERTLSAYRAALRMRPNVAAVEAEYAAALVDYARLVAGAGERRRAWEAWRSARRHVDRALALDDDHLLALATRSRLPRLPPGVSRAPG